MPSLLVVDAAVSPTYIVNIQFGGSMSLNFHLTVYFQADDDSGLHPTLQFVKILLLFDFSREYF